MQHFNRNLDRQRNDSKYCDVAPLRERQLKDTTLALIKLNFNKHWSVMLVGTIIRFHLLSLEQFSIEQIHEAYPALALLLIGRESGVEFFKPITKPAYKEVPG